MFTFNWQFVESRLEIIALQSIDGTALRAAAKVQTLSDDFVHVTHFPPGSSLG